MALAILTCVLVSGAGFALVRLLSGKKSGSQLGLAPAVGLAGLAIVTTWTSWLGLAPVFGTLVLGGGALAGAVLAFREGTAVRQALRADRGEDRLVLLILVAGLAIPAFVLGSVLGSVEAPLSTHDGAFHVERIHALRQGARWLDWYPPGFHTSIAAMLTLVPGLDTAQGAFSASLGLAMLAPLAVFGLGYAVWRDRLAAAAAAVLIGLTYIYPYYPQMWSGWPLAASIILVLGLWTTLTDYRESPTMRMAILVGILAAALLLVHGTELYTAIIGLVVLGLADWRRIAWWRLPRDVLVGLGIAAVMVGPYLPNMLTWAATGGAYAVAYQQGAEVQWSIEQPDQAYQAALNTLGVGLPLRVLLLLAGIWWTFRTRTGRRVFAIGAIFLSIALTFSSVHRLFLLSLFALVFPWGQQFRLLMIVAIALALLEGAGVRAIAHGLNGLGQRWARWRWLPRVASGHLRTAAVVCVSAGTVVSITTMADVVAGAAAPLTTYSGRDTDDAAAMAWLRQNARPGDVVANDAFADSGIWAPYKAGVEVLLPRASSGRGADGRALILANIGDLDSAPAAAELACALHVRYVYNGAAGTAWERRHFPSLAVMRQSSGLEELFSSGNAVVFGIRLPCPS